MLKLFFLARQNIMRKPSNTDDQSTVLYRVSICETITQDCLMIQLSGLPNVTGCIPFKTVILKLHMTMNSLIE